MMALSSQKSISSFFQKLEKQSCALPLETLRLYNNKEELTGLCFLSQCDVGSIEQALSSIVAAKGGSVSHVSGSSPSSLPVSDFSFASSSKPAGKKEIENTLQLEMDATCVKRVPCSLLLLRLTGKRVQGASQNEVADSRIFHALIAEQTQLLGENSMAGLYAQNAGASSFSCDFFFVLPGTGLQRVTKEVEALRKAIKKSQKGDFCLQNCLMSGAVGVFHASDRITAAELTGKVVMELDRSEKKNGTLSIVTCASRENCQVSVAERTQLLGFINR